MILNEGDASDSASFVFRDDDELLPHLNPFSISEENQIKFADGSQCRENVTPTIDTVSGGCEYTYTKELKKTPVVGHR